MASSPRRWPWTRSPLWVPGQSGWASSCCASQTAERSPRKWYNSPTYEQPKPCAMYIANNLAVFCDPNSTTSFQAVNVFSINCSNKDGSVEPQDMVPLSHMLAAQACSMHIANYLAVFCDPNSTTSFQAVNVFSINCSNKDGSVEPQDMVPLSHMLAAQACSMHIAR